MLCNIFRVGLQLFISKIILLLQVSLRSGVVLGRNGGMIKNLYVPFFLGLGGPIGSGKQYLPWIHIDDLTSLISFCIDKDINGVVNGVAPDSTNNLQFSNVCIHIFLSLIVLFMVLVLNCKYMLLNFRHLQDRCRGRHFFLHLSLFSTLFTAKKEPS